MGPWEGIWVPECAYGLRYPMGWALAIPTRTPPGYYPSTPGTPTTVLGDTVEPAGGRIQPCSTLTPCLSKLPVVDHRFTVTPTNRQTDLPLCLRHVPPTFRMCLLS